MKMKRDKINELKRFIVLLLCIVMVFEPSMNAFATSNSECTPIEESSEVKTEEVSEELIQEELPPEEYDSIETEYYSEEDTDELSTDIDNNEISQYYVEEEIIEETSEYQNENQITNEVIIFDNNIDGDYTNLSTFDYLFDRVNYDDIVFIGSDFTIIEEIGEEEISILHTCTANSSSPVSLPDDCYYTNRKGMKCSCGQILYVTSKTKKASPTHYVTGQSKVITEPTCLSSGKGSIVCNRCGDPVGSPYDIAPKGHNDNSPWTIIQNETCTIPGIRYKYCNNNGCGVLFKTENFGPKQHSFNGSRSTIKEATCTEGGETGIYCSNGCGEVVGRKDTEPKGHSPKGDWYIIKNPTCEGYGVKKRNCYNCNGESQQIQPLDHLPEGDCTKERICGRINNSVKCGKKLSTFNEHNYGSDNICIREGCKVSKVACSHTKWVKISETQHRCVNCPSEVRNHTERVEHSVIPTCTIKGKDLIYCTTCSPNTVVREVTLDKDPNNHNFEDGKRCKNGCGAEKEESWWSEFATAIETAIYDVQNYVQDPVNVCTGAHVIDIDVISTNSAQNMGIGLHYESNQGAVGIFGKGFSWNYENWVEERDDKVLVYLSPSSYIPFELVSGSRNEYVTETDGYREDRLTKNTDGIYSLKSKGKIFVFDKEKRLSVVTSKIGQKIKLTYSGYQIDITDTVSGQKLSLIKNSNNLVKEVKNEAGTHATFTYNDDGTLKEYVDIDGYKTTYKYNELGQVTSVIIEENGKNITKFKDEYLDGRVVKQIDALGNVATFEYSDVDEEGNRTTVSTNREGHKKVFTYNEKNQLISLKDEKGYTTTYCYDERGNKIEEKDALGNITSFEYNNHNNITKRKDANGNSTSYTYDNNDNLTEIVYADGSKATFEYDLKNRLVSSIDLRGLKTVNTYDDNGYLVSVKSGNREVKYTYEKGHVKTVTDQGGRKTTHNYDSNGIVSEVIDPSGAVVKNTSINSGLVNKSIDPLSNTKSYTYNSMQQVLTETDEAGNTVINEYDSAFLLKSTTDAMGNKTTYEYDKEERLVKTTYADGATERRKYDPTGGLVSSIDGEGNVITYTLDAVGNIIQEKNPHGGITKYTYTKTGKIKTKTDPSGHKVSYTYDNLDRIETITNAMGGVTKYTYNSAGDILTVTDPVGNVTTYEYDVFGKKISEKDPKGNKTLYRYDINGNLEEVEDAHHNITYYEYDKCNRLVCEGKKTSNDDVCNVFEYDAKGQLIAVIDPLEHKTQNEYDAKGNIVSKIDANNAKTTFEYNANNQLVSMTDANNHCTKYSINKVGQVVKKLDANEYSTFFEYDKNGQLVETMNELGDVSRQNYNELGSVTSIVGPLSGTTNFEYDLEGNMTSKSTINGSKVKYSYNSLDVIGEVISATYQKTTYSYDKAGRIVKVTLPGDEGTISYTYDKNSNVLTVTDKNGIVRRTYDELNNVTSITDSNNRTVKYSYDSLGHVIKITYPDNTSVKYTYDLAGNMKTVTDWNNRVTEYTYDDVNNIVNIKYPTGGKVEYEYDKVGNLVKKKDQDPGWYYWIPGAYTCYSYDNTNHLISERYKEEYEDFQYSYDELYRITNRKTIIHDDGTLIAEEKYRYDEACNIISSNVNGKYKSFTYNQDYNTLSSYNGSRSIFDDNGNMIGLRLSEGSLDLWYDSQNHLTYANGDTYAYDAEDYRIKSTIKVKEKRAVQVSNTGKSSTELLSISENEEADDKVNKSAVEVIEETAEGSYEETVSEEELASEEDTEALEDTTTHSSDETEETTKEEHVDEEVTQEDSLVETASGEESESTAEEFTETSTTEEISEITSIKELTKEIAATKRPILDNLTFEEATLETDLHIIETEVEEMATTEYYIKTVETEYCYDRLFKNLLVRYTNDGLTEKYVYGVSLLYSEAIEDDDSEAQYKQYHYDIRGSVTGITDENNDVIARYSYSTYGIRKTLMGRDDEIIGYNGRDGVITERNGLLYMRARYYCPEIMRFINQDIIVGDISSSNSLNRYAFVEGNPASMVDPFGLCAERTAEQRSVLANDLRTISILIENNLLTSFVLGEAATALNLAANMLEGNFADAAADAAILAATALLGKGAGKLAGKLAKKFVTPLAKKGLSCTASSVLDGVITYGIQGAVEGGFSDAANTFYQTGGDWDATWDSFVDGAKQGFISGGIAGGISGGMHSSYCFIAGTQVITIAGSVAIEDIRAGDYVLSCNPDTGDITYKRVLETYINEANTLVHVTTDEDNITATPIHPFYVIYKGWVNAGDLKIGDKLVDKEGNTILVKSVEIEELESSIKVYNFAVEDYHTYYVGNGLLVHNTCGDVPEGSTNSVDTPINSGVSQPRDVASPNSIYEQINPDGTVKSRAFYDENGRQFSRQDFDHRHFDKKTKQYYQPHEHNYYYNKNGQPIGKSDGPLPSGYTNMLTK